MVQEINPAKLNFAKIPPPAKVQKRNHPDQLIRRQLESTSEDVNLWEHFFSAIV